MHIALTPEWLAVGKALRAQGAAFSIGSAADGKPVAYCYVNSVAVATVSGTDVPTLLRNLAYLAEEAGKEKR